MNQSITDLPPAASLDLGELGAFYRRHLERDVLPFWLGAPSDRVHGGVFTCIDNYTGARVSDDKFVWSQGRFAWLMAHAARLVRAGLLTGDADDLTARAVETVEFLRANAFLADGAVAYLLAADGRKLEFMPGKGHDLSYFADCFVALALSETARATGQWDYLDEAVATYERVGERLAAGTARSEPYPLPARCRAHAEPMILLNVAQELELALRQRGDPRSDALAASALAHMDAVLTKFVRPDGLVQEVICPAAASGAASSGRLLTSHVTPGHAIESMWFVMEEAARHGRDAAVEEAARVLLASFEAGWDPQHGGIFRYVGGDGRPPTGRAEGAFEELILATWDTKIWWPHSETLYGALLGHVLTGDARLRAVHDRTFDYVFATFPHPDEGVGEWVQIRDRRGAPLDRVVGLPVKDPYHLNRNLMLLVELLQGGSSARTTVA